jgi:hypothetical protein
MTANVQSKKKTLFLNLEGLGAKTEPIGDKPPVVKLTLMLSL